MKADPEVKMISAEAPILFAKGCDIFITELTMRAWIHAEENKRRTLQRSDIASALAKSDMFDFLIDIVPREEAASHAKRATGQPAPTPGVAGAPTGTAIPTQHPIPHQAGPGGNMGPPPYNPALGGHGLGQEQEYAQSTNIYSNPVQPGGGAYGAPGQQMYQEMEGIYGGYPAMQAQQVSANLPSKNHPLTPRQQMYHVQQQRPQDPSVGHDAGHNYPRNDGGEGDADAEGERDYEVG